MRETPDHVTIVMATRNGAAHLRAQLDSIAAQSHRNWSLFVSDDGSADATRQILADFARHHPLRLVEGPGRGAAANFLSALCHPELPPGPVALADQDDVWLKGKLARGLRRMAVGGRRRGDGPVLYAAESMLADGGLKLLSRSKSGRVRPGFAPSLAQNLFAGHSTMLNPEALELVRRAGVPPGVVWHDWWLYQLLAGAGAALILDPAPSVIWRQHGANTLGGARGAAAGLKRLAMVLSGEWGRTMQAHARALQQNAPLLEAEARAVLEGFLSAPGRGMGRVRLFRDLGIRRSSPAGDLTMLAAAALGRL
ncbi:glycosyltransferase [Pseudogemmobacter humi]|uniref:UDP-Glc:alpha-D-GlcNAc-diphosphoundecaprenol beta-1,3-glucosyltransferase WfgD n=1 Tax=Pseudogemmobacter humi TaxID=2483812 RepID=A0A3P5XEL8_9RHOB|nr:glycosyltransferase [Pseudogemmobacter humi]VDC33184.1 UDP-Glc:alpha-D-GlcNAc-diphosphoundecaprenol beta-1,3-glucosyltransferase WfgD [Pseudogemmobacter humi]